jgi:uncharacterized protein
MIGRTVYRDNVPTKSARSFYIEIFLEVWVFSHSAGAAGANSALNMVTLTDDEIDDVLYLARVNEVDELSTFIAELTVQHKCSSTDILVAAVDSENGNTALHYAGANGHTSVLMLLTNLCAPNPLPHLNTKNISGNTPLHWAALNGHLPFVQAIVKHGADVDILNKVGHDAIFEAELNDKREVAEWLLKEGDGLEKGLTSTDGEASGETRSFNEESLVTETANMNMADQEQDAER